MKFLHVRLQAPAASVGALRDLYGTTLGLEIGEACDTRPGVARLADSGSTIRSEARA